MLNYKKIIFLSIALLIFDTGLFVSGESLFGSTQKGQDKIQTKTYVDKVKMQIFFLRIEMKNFQEKYGNKPASSAEFLNYIKKNNSENLFQWFLLDPWGNEYRFVDSNGKMQIVSLGKDNQPGGVSLDRDFDLLDEGIYELLEEHDRIKQSEDNLFYFLVAVGVVFIFFLFYFFVRDKKKA